MDRLLTLNPETAAAIRASFSRQGLMMTLGAVLVDVGPGAVTIEMPRAAHIAQQQGQPHGSAIGAIAETAGGYAALSLMPVGSEVTTVEYKINFVRLARGDVVRARAKVARAGRSVTVATVEVASGSGGSFELCAIVQGTFMRIAVDA